MRLGVYGGSFDPPHVAHVLLAAYALSVGRFDRVIVIPVFAHAFNKAHTPFEHRAKMCEHAFRDLDRVTVSRIESTLPTPSRTLATLEALEREHRDAELSLVIGSDVLADVSKWHAFDVIARLAPPFVVERGRETASAASKFHLPDISSSRVRELLATSSESESRTELLSLVPTSVMDYVMEHGLYRISPGV
jgi:nicotinate-nucleotide adenylyltransferase